jgi:hypothetical protein
MLCADTNKIGSWYHNYGYRVMPGYKPQSGEITGRWAGSHDFLVEYSKSNKATCRACGTMIPEAAIRLGLMVVELEGDGYKSTYWYHFNCGFHHRETLKMKDPVKDCVGFSSLKPEDQKKVKDAFDDMKARVVKDPPAPDPNNEIDEHNAALEAEFDSSPKITPKKAAKKAIKPSPKSKMPAKAKVAAKPKAAPSKKKVTAAAATGKKAVVASPKVKKAPKSSPKAKGAKKK